MQLFLSIIFIFMVSGVPDSWGADDDGQCAGIESVGTPCDDHNADTENDLCNADGNCVGTELSDLSNNPSLAPTNEPSPEPTVSNPTANPTTVTTVTCETKGLTGSTNYIYTWCGTEKTSCYDVHGVMYDQVGSAIDCSGKPCYDFDGNFQGTCESAVPYWRLHVGKECKSDDEYMGVYTERECAEAVSLANGRYFVWGTGEKEGHCYREKTYREKIDSMYCEEGWEIDHFNFYTLNITDVPGKWYDEHVHTHTGSYYARPKHCYSWTDAIVGSISGNNIKCYSGRSLDECKLLCEENVNCLSLDVRNSDGHCCLGTCKIGDGCSNDDDTTYEYYECNAYVMPDRRLLQMAEQQ